MDRDIEYVKQVLEGIHNLLGNIQSALDVVKVELNNLEVYLGGESMPEASQSIEEAKEQLRMKSGSKGLEKYTGRMASEKQIQYLERLYNILGEKPNIDLKTISSETASKLIDELKREVTRRNLWPKKR